MPHPRYRFAIEQILKKLKFSRVVSIQGARQTGKSFLARDLLKNSLKKSKYISLDSKEERVLAENSPSIFMDRFEDSTPLIIDEAQKAPSLFDEIKLRVDSITQPGRFLLLGSTEFSKELLVRESLTGRLGRIRIFPMNFLEFMGSEYSHNKKKLAAIKSTAFLEYINRGGMPGIAFVRDAKARRSLVLDWINLVCYRDLSLFKTHRLDSDLAIELLHGTSILEEPNLANLARFTKTSAKKIELHLKVLEQLFAIYKIYPHNSCRSKKPIFFPFDASISWYFNAPLRRRIQITLLNERHCLNHYQNRPDVRFYYYKSKSRQLLDLVEMSTNALCGFLIIDNESFSAVDLALIKAFQDKSPEALCTVYAPIKEEYLVTNNGKKILVRPWQAMLTEWI
jgi:predicted AAA+ superfamily ATPase